MDGRIVGVASMVPTGWTGRMVKLEYVGGAEGARSTSGKLLDVAGAGPVPGIEGSRTLFPWGVVVLMELVEE